MALSPLTQGRLLALAAPLFWSTTGVAVRLMRDADEWQINFYRSVTLAAFVLLVLLVRNGRATFRVICRAGWTGVIAGVLVGASMLSNIVALQHTTVANATMLMASGPLFAALLGRVFLRERTSRTTWCAIALAFVGILVMVSGGVRTDSLFGDSIALLGVVFFGAYAVMLRRGAETDMTPAVLMAGVFSAAVAATAALTIGRGLDTEPFDVWLCVALGVFQLGIGSILFAIASKSVSATELTLFALGEPVLAPVWTWLAVGEAPALETFIGGGIMIAALLLLSRASHAASR